MKMKGLVLLMLVALLSVFTLAPVPAWAQEDDDDEAMAVEPAAKPAEKPEKKEKKEKADKPEKKEKKGKKGKLEEGETIDINKADVKEFCRVPGIGKATAEKLVDLRDEKGGSFKSIDELGAVLKKKLDKMSPFFTLGGKAPAKPGEKKPAAKPEAKPAADEDEDDE